MGSQIELISRPTLVLMAGLPGAGKTSLAYELGRELQWHVIDKDMYKEVLVKQGLDDNNAGIAAYELSFAIARTVMKRQQASIILDTAAIQRFIIDDVREIVDCIIGSRLKVILCVADRDLRNERLRIRTYKSTSIQVDPATTADYLQYFEHLPPDKLIRKSQSNVGLSGAGPESARLTERGIENTHHMLHI